MGIERDGAWKKEKPREISRIEDARRVFNALTGLNGENICEQTIEELQAGALKNIFICGPPAHGKSTISLGLRLESEKRGLPHKFRTIYFDDIRAQMLKSREQKDTGDWEDKDWCNLGKDMIRRIEEPVGENTITIVELVGIGKKNRGTTVLEHFAKSIADSKHPDKLQDLVLFVAADPRIIDGEKKNRGLIVLPEPVFELLKLQNSSNPTEVLFKFIDELSRRASPTHIAIIELEIERLIAELIVKGDLRFEQILTGVSLPQSGLIERDEKSFRQKAAYMEYALRELLHLDQKSGKVAINSYIEDIGIIPEIANYIQPKKIK